MFTNFEPRLFDDPDFKEDAVREVIIAPMLSRLGYHPVGPDRVLRSKHLMHPYIYIGTRKHPVTIIPDYTLLHDDRPILILDAKSPHENVLSEANVQQAYSYTIHPEIRCGHFALCNGRVLAFFSVDAAKPLLLLSFEEFKSRWSDIERHLAPKYLLEPRLRGMKPDFGFKIAQTGVAPETDLVMLGVRLGLYARITDSLYTATANCSFGEEDHCVSYDFDSTFLTPILAGLPPVLASRFREALSRAPYQASADLVIELDLKAHLGEPVQVQHETFIPLVVTEVLASRFNPEHVENEPTDIPPHVFRLRKAFRLVSPDDQPECVE
ncbi:MAG TPA: hypothetical protein VNA69_00585 [Thermoanaerobaculia bacterium]|nr:hypothetical protein [Thermoanaerobaculia bacterium]